MDECIFCNIKKIAEQGILYEDKQCYVALNQYPVRRGHLLVVSKRHYKDMTDAPSKLLSHMAPIIKRFTLEVNNIFKPKSIKVITNIGDEEEILHFHVHILPLYEERAADPHIKGYKMRKKISEGEKGELLKKFKKYEKNK
ncbi:MAG: HIT family protein [Candidatus Marsarchaeota archaeon]|jgi:histidine triad (HIT) family protein|nr:HIT family protein [Candidatus Marsarchaeota archaeon]